MKRLREFTTDEKGAPLLRGHLLRQNATYVFEPKRLRVTNRLDRASLSRWVDDAVIGDLETLLQGIDSRESDSPRGEGNFLLLAGCLMALEYFATLYLGESLGTQARVERFSERFLVPLDDHYGTCWDVLWPAARNGILHGFWPSRLRTAIGNEYRFRIGCEENMPHLQLAPVDNAARTEVALCVNARRMLLDLKTGVTRRDGFQQWIVEEADDAAIVRGQPFIIETIGENGLEGWRTAPTRVHDGAG